MTYKNNILTGAVALVLGFAPPAFADMSNINEQTQDSITLAESFYEDVLVYRNLNNFGKYIEDVYVQHATAYGDGPAAMMGAVATELTADPNVKIDLYRTIAEGPYVAIHSVWTASSGEQYVYVDIWKVDNGKLVEHWDHYQQVPDKTENNNTMYQGPDTNIYTSKQNIERNRERAVKMVKAFDNRANAKEAASIISPNNFIQHHPKIGNGHRGLISHYKKRAKTKQTFETNIAKTLAMGDMVLVHSNRTNANNEADLGVGLMDIFRFDDSGKVVEHWNIEENQTGKSANENDVFGYPEN